MNMRKKRERRKIEKQRKFRWQRDSRRSARTLAAAGAIALGTQAYAVPVRFENPSGAGHFDWGVDAAGAIFLEVREDQAGQPGLQNSPSSFFQNVNSGYPYGIVGALSGATETDGSALSECFGYPRLISSSLGDSIPSGATWQPGTAITALGGYCPSLIPEGVQTYLGVRFNPGDGLHYGWIGVVRSGFELEAFAWGYETEPGVPIGICNDTEPDVDADDVVDCHDVCLDTPPAQPIDGDGRPVGDINRDCKIDGGDIQAFVNGFLGS